MALKENQGRDVEEASVPSDGRKGAPARRRAPGPSQADSLKAEAFNIWSFAGTLVGWAFLLLGQRVLAPMEGLAKMCTWAALLLLFASFGQRLWAMMDAPADRRDSARAFAVLSAVGIAALVLYGTTTDWGHEVFGIARPKAGEDDAFTNVIHVTWIALFVASVVPTILGEIARQSMLRAPRIESRRIIAAVVGGLAIAFALVYGALFTYGAGKVEWSADFSFFRAAAPSESTANMLATVEEPVKVRLYFPPQSEVGQKVERYLADLNARTGKLEVAAHDRLLVPDLAKEDKVRQDGVVVVARGAQTEQLTIGVEEARAANTLRKLDGEFQTVLLKVLRAKRTAYLTVGHGELNEETDKQTRRTVNLAREILQSQNYGIKNLGLKEGLGSQVPDDATVVFVLGPSTPFSDAEIETLKRYADGGGALFIALDPESREPELARVAEIVGVKWSPDLVINDQILFAVDRTSSDKKNLAAGSFSAHASVSSLMKLSQRGAAVLLAGAGPLEPIEGRGYKVDPAVKSPPQSYLDLNGNWSFDADSEKKAVFNLVVAATRALDPGAEPKKGPEARAIVVGDAGAFTDPFMQFAQTNQLLFLDAFRWLGGEESFIGGAITDEEDIRIVHTQDEDQLWFYGTIVVVPGMVLGLGLLFTRRRRHKTGPHTTNEGDRPRPGPEKGSGGTRRAKARPRGERDGDAKPIVDEPQDDDDSVSDEPSNEDAPSDEASNHDDEELSDEASNDDEDDEVGSEDEEKRP
jgi:hypothetical protein